MHPVLNSRRVPMMVGLMTAAPLVSHAAPEPAPTVVILGIAQDAGHPQAGCTQSCCAAAHDDPTAAHHVASLGIIDGDYRVLIDATPDLPAQLHALSPTGRLDAIVLTHAHIGHYTGLVHLGREAMGAAGVAVYAMPRMKAFLGSDRPWSLLVSQKHIDLHSMTDGAPIQITPRVSLTPFVVPHRDEVSETVGFIIQGPQRSIAFVPDIDKWSRWERPIEQLIAQVDVALLDGTFYGNGEIARDMSLIPHPFVEESIQRFTPLPKKERSKVRFIHLNHSNPLLNPKSDATQTVRAAGMAIAKEGEQIAL
ncbi:MAG: MBL fold metallo-hydrolase [Myxococcota bacterium]